MIEKIYDRSNLGDTGFKNFLLYLDQYPNKTQYAKITVLDWNEAEVEDITGRVTGGSLTLSGTSTVRRNGSISLCLAENDTFYKIEDINNLLSLNKKVKIQIGFDIDFRLAAYNEVVERIWFPLGVFIIKDPTLNRSSSGLTLSLSLSDKMALLNGEAGGSLPAAIVFSETDTQNADGTWTKTYNKIKDIIISLVREHGGIPNDKIKIEDVDERAQKVMKWTDAGNLYQYERGGVKYLDTATPDGANELAIYTSGENIGFILTDFTWPGQALTANAGETVTSVLDKIKTLGDYEYFFDIDGNFVWQRKKVYVYNNNDQSIPQADFYIGDTEVAKAMVPQSFNSNNNISYDFTNSPLVISYSNTPQYKNIKNDYVVWGKRKTSSGAEMPIRYHTLFDNFSRYQGTEMVGVTFQGYWYLIAEPDIKGFKVLTRGAEISDTIKPQANKYYWTSNETSYYIYDFNLKQYIKLENGLQSYTISEGDNWRTVLYFKGRDIEAQGVESVYYEDYYNHPLLKDLDIEWPKLYDLENRRFRVSTPQKDQQYPDGDTIDYYCHVIDGGNNLNYQSVGRYLTKVINDTNINCVYFPDIGANLILRIGEEFPEGYADTENINVIRVSSEIYDELYAGGSQNSAFEQTRALVTQGTSYANSISLSTIPIYYLEPNTLIKVKDEESNIDGVYVINSISLPLAYNGNMTISAAVALTQTTATVSN